MVVNWGEKTDSEQQAEQDWMMWGCVRRSRPASSVRPRYKAAVNASIWEGRSKGRLPVCVCAVRPKFSGNETDGRTGERTNERVRSFVRRTKCCRRSFTEQRHIKFDIAALLFFSSSAVRSLFYCCCCPTKKQPINESSRVIIINYHDNVGRQLTY